MHVSYLSIPAIIYILPSSLNVIALIFLASDVLKKEIIVAG
jgi:hypothetical protein